jgi:hypothetical protein
MGRVKNNVLATGREGGKEQLRSVLCKTKGYSTIEERDWHKIPVDAMQWKKDGNLHVRARA